MLISYLSEHRDAGETASWVKKAGRKAVLVAGDIGKEQHCYDLVERAVAELGRLDILVNNAAFQRTHEKLADFSAEEIDRTFRTNIQSMFFLAKADDHPLTLGGIGLLGTRPSQEAFEECDTLLIVGSTFPYIEYYPKPGQARGIQIDTDASRVGLRFPVDVGLVGDAQQTLQLLNSRLTRRPDRSFLEQSQARKQAWQQLLSDSARQDGEMLSPGHLAQELGEQLAEDAIVAWDSGHNTGVLARYVHAKAHQMFNGSGMMATMASSVPYAIAAALAYLGRHVPRQPRVPV